MPPHRRGGGRAYGSLNPADRDILGTLSPENLNSEIGRSGLLNFRKSGDDRKTGSLVNPEWIREGLLL